jgi:Spy/CpxP family protein refolding chaperone
MKGSILKYILIVSLLMNFTFLGAAAYTHYRQIHYHHTAPFLGPHGAPGPHGLSGPGMLFEALSLKPEQMKVFQQKAEVFHGSLAKKRQEVDSLRGSLFALMRADNPDARAIDAAIVQINTAQQEIQRSVLSHMLEFKSMLDKEQQKTFLDLIQRAMDRPNDALCP